MSTINMWKHVFFAVFCLGKALAKNVKNGFSNPKDTKLPTPSHLHYPPRNWHVAPENRPDSQKESRLANTIFSRANWLLVLYRGWYFSICRPTKDAPTHLDLQVRCLEKVIQNSKSQMVVKDGENLIPWDHNPYKITKQKQIPLHWFIMLPIYTMASFSSPTNTLTNRLGPFCKKKRSLGEKPRTQFAGRNPVMESISAKPSSETKCRQPLDKKPTGF